MSSLESKIKSRELDLFFKAILKLEDIEECYKFFEDVATINEVKALAQRLHVATLLNKKKTYSEIAEVTGASTATISRVNRCLNYGSDGYNLILDNCCICRKKISVSNYISLSYYGGVCENCPKEYGLNISKESSRSNVNIK